MRLWSIQPPIAAERLRAGLPLAGAPDFEAAWGWEPSHPWGFKQAYAWIASAMRERLGPPPAGEPYPVWAWARPPSSTRSGAPDMRSMREAEPCVLLELEVDAERALLSDHGLWHIVLNGGVLALTEQGVEREEARLAALCSKLGLPTGPRGRLAAEHYAHPDVLALLSEGWSRVFELAPLVEGRSARMAFSDPADSEWVQVDGICAQACLWRIEPSDVRSARSFGARPSARRAP